MSTNHTGNYHLCQWEPSDQVLRTDFNADNAKLDAALAGLARQNAATLSLAQNTANNAYTSSHQAVIVGSYAGDEKSSRTLNIGFRPRAVLIFPLNGYLLERSPNTLIVYSGTALDGVNGGTNQTVSVTILDTGFRVYNVVGNMMDYQLNKESFTYVYFAFR